CVRIRYFRTHFAAVRIKRLSASSAQISENILAAICVLESALDGTRGKFSRGEATPVEASGSCGRLAFGCVAQRGGKNSGAAYASGALPQGMPGSSGRRQGLAEAAGRNEERILRAGK